MEDMPLSFSCSDCQRHFPNLPELARHRELRHSSAKQDGEEADGIPHPYGSHPENLANHQRNHETLFFPCTTCGKDFSNRLALQSHMRTHAPESHRRHGPPHAMETAPHLGSETMATDSWGQRLGSGEGWENQTKLVRETHDWESGADPRAASGTWEDPPTKQRQGLEMQPDSKGGTADWVPAVSSEGGQSSVSSTALTSAENTPKVDEVPTASLDHRPYKCNECGRAYRHRGSLVNHRHSHRTGEYQCSLCPRKYPNLMALRNHVRVHCKATRRSTDPGTEGSPSPVKKEQHDPVGMEAAFHGDEEHACKREEEATSNPSRLSEPLPGFRAMDGSMHPRRDHSPVLIVLAASATESAFCDTSSSTRKSGQCRAQEPQWHQQQAERIPLQPRFRTPHPSGLQTSVSPSE